MPAAHATRSGFFGRTLRRGSFGDFTIVEKLHDADESIPEHEHEQAYASFVMAGRYTERVAGRESILPRGSVVLHPHRERHANRFADREATVISVSIPAFLAERWPESRRLESIGEPTVGIIGARLRHELDRNDDVSPIVVEGLILELQGTMLRHCDAGKSGSIARHAEILIRERWSSAIGLRDLAAELGVDASGLSRAFRREIGCSVGERIRQVRVEHARQALSTNTPLADIALAAGFCDQSHFTRTFRAMIGMTPREYRMTLG